MISFSILYEQKINAPTFIYKILNNKFKNMTGNLYNHPQKIINGISIDEKIPSSSFKKLLKIKEIELRSSCQGHNSDRPTFLIIRLIDDSINIDKFVENLNKNKNIKAGYDLGNNNKYRIGITTYNLWYTENNKKEFEKWWNNLYDIIQNSINLIT